MTKLTQAEYEEVYEDFKKCYELVNRLAILYPTVPGVWTGSVSERLQAGLTAMQTEKISTLTEYRDALKDSLSKSDKINAIQKIIEDGVQSIASARPYDVSASSMTSEKRLQHIETVSNILFRTLSRIGETIL